MIGKRQVSSAKTGMICKVSWKEIGMNLFLSTTITKREKTIDREVIALL
jgi:hypothetical protein